MALIWYICWRLAQDNALVHDGGIKNNNTEIAVGMQTGDRVQDTDQAVESVVDNNITTDTASQQGHASAMQEATRSAVEVPQAIENAGPPQSWVAKAAVSKPLMSGLACILPCLASKLVSVLFLVAVIVPSIVLIALNAVGPLQCPDDGRARADLAIPLTVAIIMLAVVVACCSCIIRICSQSGWLFYLFNGCCWMFVIMLVALVIMSSILVFQSYQRERQDSTTMCRYVEVVVATIAAAYLFIALMCLSITVSCCYICKRKRNRNVPVCHCQTHTDV